MTSPHLARLLPLPPAPSTVGQIRWAGLLRCEGRKLLTLRSTKATLAAIALVIVLTGPALTAVTPRPGADVHPDDIAAAFSLPLAGTVLARCLAAAFGVVAITGDLGTGMIRTTLMAAPRRGRLLVAKAVVLTSITAAVCAPATVTAWLVGNAILSRRGLAAPLTDPQVWQALAGNTVVLVGLTLVGLTAGILLRSAAAAICLLLTAIFVVPVILDALPSNAISHFLLQWWLTETLTNVVDIADHSSALPGPTGLLAFAAWLVWLFTAASGAFTTRTP